MRCPCRRWPSATCRQPAAIVVAGVAVADALSLHEMAFCDLQAAGAYSRDDCRLHLVAGVGGWR
eukprot:6032637-Prymnesium_polylepis.1